METTIKKTTNQCDFILLFLIIIVSIISFQQLIKPHFHSFSKIEEGEIVMRDDSVKTVLIPDLR